MAAATDIQSLLRFLTQDARIPLSNAMSKIKALQSASLTSAALIAASKLPILQPIFDNDAKISRQVLASAKRVTTREPGDNGSAKLKRKRAADGPLVVDKHREDEDVEKQLTLPHIDAVQVVDEIAGTILITNRAPLFLAFAVTLLKYTMPSQPLSSRLSLAQAVVSVNARSKAVSIGLEKGKSAEEEGWGKGQPEVRVMGRSIRVLRRWEYQRDNGGVGRVVDATKDGGGEQTPVKEENTTEQVQSGEPALWGLDLEALKNSNRPTSGEASALPIYTPQSARAYIIKSFASAQSAAPSAPTIAEDASPAKKLKTVKDRGKSVQEEKERNLALLLGALDLLYQSWIHLDLAELDRRAWGWYVSVRPDVESGVAGWGGKGKVKLKDILDLRKPA